MFSQHTSLAKPFLFPVKHFEKILLMREGKKKIPKRSQTTKITIWKIHVDGIHLKRKKRKLNPSFLITIIALVETEGDFCSRRHGNQLVLIYWICIYIKILHLRGVHIFLQFQINIVSRKHTAQYTKGHKSTHIQRQSCESNLVFRFKGMFCVC